MLIHNADDIQFVTEFPCFLGHPVVKLNFSDFQDKNLLRLKDKHKLFEKHTF